jgi:radical SAM enzyme (TIGR01210 family)
MCDLWRNTTAESVAPGAVPAQIRHALAELGSHKPSVLKLYNSGSFFDQGAIPRLDWEEIAALCSGFKHVIVEGHPRLIDQRVLEFRELLDCSLEVAVGLETANPAALEAINKRMTLEDYRAAAALLRRNAIALRTFLLISAPFIAAEEQTLWLTQSMEFAFDAGSAVVSLIPLRAGNGAIEALIKGGLAEEPGLDQIEEASELGVRLGRGLVLTDTWDLERFARCRECFPSRRDRLGRLNRTQKIEPRINCARCGSDRGS